MAARPPPFVQALFGHHLPGFGWGSGFVGVTGGDGILEFGVDQSLAVATGHRISVTASGCTQMRILS